MKKHLFKKKEFSFVRCIVKISFLNVTILTPEHDCHLERHLQLDLIHSKSKKSKLSPLWMVNLFTLFCRSTLCIFPFSIAQ